MQQFNHNQHVRLRPGMYFGGTNARALHEVVFTVLEDILEEVTRDYCDHIWITLLPDDAISIRDNSRGLPIQSHTDGRSLLEHLMTGPGTKRIEGEYQVVGGMFGVRLSAVNAISAECTVEVARDGFLWRQTYREGVPQSEVVQVRPLQAG